LKEFQRVVLESESLHVEVIPALGAKITSMRMVTDGAELLQLPLLPYAERTRTMAFDEADASGFDECLPTVSGCEFETATGRVAVPDHGDFWRIPWQVVPTKGVSGREVILRATGFTLPLEFTKTLRLEGGELAIHYSVRNAGEVPCEFLWSAHPLFAVDAGDRIVLPPSVATLLVEGSAKNRLGTAGRVCAWPIAVLASGASVDLSECGAMQDEVGDKLYTGAPKEGWCALQRKKLQTRIEVRFNPGETPFLGVWLCYGGWPLQREKRGQCVALEPCMAPTDSLAIASKEGWTKKLEAKAVCEWSVSIRITTTNN
jgi:galactose mutarotase-like enzyme